MSFDWNNYLTLAKELSNDKHLKSDKEAKTRTAISRAYYAVIIIARNKICNKLQVTAPQQSTHQWVINKYYNDGKDGRDIAKKIKRLKNRRVKADYFDHITKPEEELKFTLYESEKIMNKLKNY